MSGGRRLRGHSCGSHGRRRATRGWRGGMSRRRSAPRACSLSRGRSSPTRRACTRRFRAWRRRSSRRSRYWRSTVTSPPAGRCSGAIRRRRRARRLGRTCVCGPAAGTTNSAQRQLAEAGSAREYVATSLPLRCTIRFLCSEQLPVAPLTGQTAQALSTGVRFERRERVDQGGEIEFRFSDGLQNFHFSYFPATSTCAGWRGSSPNGMPGSKRPARAPTSSPTTAVPSPIANRCGSGWSGTSEKKAWGLRPEA